MVKYKLIQYEVWGNYREGYEINNAFVIDTLETDKEIEDIKDVRKLIPSLGRNVFIDPKYDSEFSIYLIKGKREKPIGELRKIHA